MKRLILTTLLTLLASKVFAFEAVGEVSQTIYTQIQGNILNQVNLVAKSLAKYTATLLGSLYTAWLMWHIFKAVVDSNGKEFIKLVFKQSFVLIACLLFIYNIDLLNKYLQKPVEDTFNMFGNSILQNSLGISGNSGLIKDLALQMQDISLALIGEKYSLLNFNVINLLVKLLVVLMLFVIFIQIFLILITNYFKIMLPFAISPILLVFFFFPSLRQIPIKALNIMLDGIIKQGFIIMVVVIMSATLKTALTNGGYGLNMFDLNQLLIIIIVSFIYKQLLTTADSLSSELINTQQLGVNPTQGGGLLGAIAGAGTMAINYLNKGGNTSLGGLAKGLASGITGQGVNTGGATSLQGKASNFAGSAIGVIPNHLTKLGWKLNKNDPQTYPLNQSFGNFNEHTSNSANNQTLQNHHGNGTPSTKINTNKLTASAKSPALHNIKPIINKKEK